MIHYRYSEADNILYVKYKGETTIEDIVNYVTEIAMDEQLPRVLYTLEDRSEAIIKHTVRENVLIYQALKEHRKNFRMVKVASVNPTPESATSALQFSHILATRLKKYHFRVFATREAALQWLMHETPAPMEHPAAG